MSSSMNSLAIGKPQQQARLDDAADFQKPVTYYLQIVKRHWLHIASISFSLTALVVIACLIAPEINSGSALIAVDRQGVPETVGDDRLLTTGDDQFMATQQNLIVADAILRPVADRFNLLEREHQLRRYFFWRYSPEKERAIREAPIELKHLKIERSPNTYLLTITYKDEDPKIAAEVANAIADSYLQYIFDTRIREAGRLTSSMEQQLVDLKEKMQSRHQALMRYQKDLGTADPEQKTSVLVAKLQALNTESSAAEADRIAKESIYREAKDGTLSEVEVSGQSIDLAQDVEKLRSANFNMALISATYGDKHPEYQKAAAQVGEARSALDEARKNVASRIAVDYRQALSRERMLSAAVAETKQEVDNLTSRSFEYLELKHEADAAEHVYEDLFAKIKQSGINSQLQNNLIRFADAARPPAKPIFPNWTIIVPLAIIFFAFASAAYFVGRDLTDATAKEPAAVQQALGVPVICALPKVSEVHLRLRPPADGTRLIGSSKPSLNSGFFYEGIRHLRGFMMFSAQATGINSVLVTSALPGEGKSTVALSLAMVQAEHGKLTLLIDSDLRQPTIERLVHLEPGPGVADVFEGTIDWREAIRPVRGCPNLFVLGSGHPSPFALTTIGSEMPTLLELLKHDFQFVVLDSPPLLGCAETLELAAATDTTLLAVRSGRTSMKALGATVDTLRRVDVPIAGIVLNQSVILPDATYKAYRRYYTALRSA
jgi:polysaccharide biosynthesis transport protein